MHLKVEHNQQGTVRARCETIRDILSKATAVVEEVGGPATKGHITQTEKPVSKVSQILRHLEELENQAQQLLECLVSLAKTLD